MFNEDEFLEDPKHNELIPNPESPPVDEKLANNEQIPGEFKEDLKTDILKKLSSNDAAMAGDFLIQRKFNHSEIGYGGEYFEVAKLGTSLTTKISLEELHGLNTNKDIEALF